MTSQVSMNGGEKQSSEKGAVTLRFELSLAPPTDDTTNEFSYVHLVNDRCKQVREWRPGQPASLPGSQPPPGGKQSVRAWSVSCATQNL